MVLHVYEMSNYNLDIKFLQFSQNVESQNMEFIYLAWILTSILSWKSKVNLHERKPQMLVET